MENVSPSGNDGSQSDAVWEKGVEKSLHFVSLLLQQQHEAVSQQPKLPLLDNNKASSHTDHSLFSLSLSQVVETMKANETATADIKTNEGKRGGGYGGRLRNAVLDGVLHTGPQGRRAFLDDYLTCDLPRLLPPPGRTDLPRAPLGFCTPCRRILPHR